MTLMLYPWFSAPLLAGTELLKLMKNVVPMGVGPFFFVEGFRDYPVPVLVALAVALVVVCVLVLRYVTLDKRTRTDPCDRPGGALS